jgi:hypothetical protein
MLTLELPYGKLEEDDQLCLSTDLEAYLDEWFSWLDETFFFGQLAPILKPLTFEWTSESLKPDDGFDTRYHFGATRRVSPYLYTKSVNPALLKISMKLYMGVILSETSMRNLLKKRTRNGDHRLMGLIVGVMLHEMVHAFLLSRTCSCFECRQWNSRQELLGRYGHGNLWSKVTYAIEVKCEELVGRSIECGISMSTWIDESDLSATCSSAVPKSIQLPKLPCTCKSPQGLSR